MEEEKDLPTILNRLDEIMDWFNGEGSVTEDLEFISQVIIECGNKAYWLAVHLGNMKYEFTMLEFQNQLALDSMAESIDKTIKITERKKMSKEKLKDKILEQKQLEGMIDKLKEIKYQANVNIEIMRQRFAYKRTIDGLTL